MAGMSVDGLISGMDTTALITQLIQAEAAPKTALESTLTATRNAASAYRTVNTTFAAVRAAAEAVLKPDAWAPTKATSSSPTSVTVSATNGATTGSLSFGVVRTAAAHSVINRNTGAWTSATSAYGTSSLTILGADGTTARTPAITIGDADGDGVRTLTDAVAAINASPHGLTAAVVEVSTGEFALHVTSKTTGAAGKFSLSGPGTQGVPTQGADAEIKIGDTADAFFARSATNTFTSVLPGVSFTVSKAEPAVTVTVADDPEAVAAKVQSLVDTVNSALTQVRGYTNNAKGSTAALKGDYPVSQLAGQLLDAVSFAIGSKSPATVGFQLSGDGKSIAFTKATFLDALKADPELTRKMVAGTAAGHGTDGIAGTVDDVAASGIAGRLLGVAKAASDSATGSLVRLAAGQDSMAEDIQSRIEAWDLRLAKRREMLTRQFSAMETALSSLRNQSTWLAGQINSLPSYS